jgi:hypothetical protein
MVNKDKKSIKVSIVEENINILDKYKELDEKCDQVIQKIRKKRIKKVA